MAQNTARPGWDTIPSQACCAQSDQASPIEKQNLEKEKEHPRSDYKRLKSDLRLKDKFSKKIYQLSKGDCNPALKSISSSRVGS